PISGMSSTGGFEAYIQNRGSGGSAALAEAVQKVVAAAQKRPELAGVSTTYSANVPQLYVELDREKAKSYGVPVSQVFDTLQSTFGALYVNDFNKFGRTYKVQIQSESDYRSRPDDLNKVYVRSQSGQMIPLGSLIHVRWITGPENQERFNVFDSAKVIGGPAPGYSSGEAIAAMQEVTRDTLGDDFTIAWTGSAYQEIATGGTSAQIFIFALIVVFLILAAQYERWKLPLAVLMAVPFALFGAILATWARDLSNDVYFQVALVTLIGLAAKNAILIVEFAILKLDEGVDLIPAAIEAAHLRFRPILMTSLAFVLGCVPLVLSSGAGAASRHSLGTGIIGGMLGATFIATFLIPLFFVLIMRIGTRKKPKAPPPAAAAEHHSEEGQS
ncbi:efflux RND transporter permease subunit, partial [Laribacter hongkongensis]